MKYRAEIDGLRAIAVIPVILFHAGFEIFSGGYLGVDVFFVISGYLITTIIATELSLGKFSYIGFYERRARRILPVLLFVLAVSAVLGLLVLDEKSLRDLGRSIVAVSIFISNIFFMFNSDYFDSLSELKLLLHTWSLAVEEQYYIAFPVLMAIVWRFCWSKILFILMLLGLVSFVVSIWCGQLSQNFNYYFTISRGWELLVGAICGMLIINKEAFRNELLSIVGMVGIFLSMVFIDSDASTPGLLTIFPVSSVALIILFSGEGTIVRKILSARPIVLLGLMSYSIYLWHQPLLAIYRHLSNEIGVAFPVGEIPLAHRMVIIGVVLLLSYLSWLYIEQPFRSKDRIFKGNRWIAASVAGISISIIIGLGLASYPDPYKKSAISSENSWDKDVLMHTCLLQDSAESRHYSECLAGDVLIWGDSHAASLSWNLRQALILKGVRLAQLTQSGCPPLTDIPNLVYRKNCNEINESVFAALDLHKYSTVVLHAAWFHEHYPMAHDEIINRLANTIDRIKSISLNSKVIVVGSVPRWRYGPKWHSVEISDDRGGFSSEGIVLTELNAKLGEVAIGHGAIFVDPYWSLCERKTDLNYCLIANENEQGKWVYAYKDYGHLLPGAAGLVVNDIMVRM